VIDTPDALSACLPALRAAPWVAIDTEADSLHSYPEKLCLVQLSAPGNDWLVDPLAGLDLAPLYAALGGHELILHGGDYDLRLLSRHAGFIPTSVFDTMMAARLIGCTQFGLGNLVEQFLGLKLEKGPQKADWSRRPLTERMADYARNDTRHLKPLADALRAQLEAKGRLAWHQEYCVRLIADNTRPETPDPDRVWRVKGSNKLSPHALAVLREIWKWREAEATGGNRPPFFVLNPERMTEIAALAVAEGDWESQVPPRYSPRRRHTLKEAVLTGLRQPRTEWPNRLRGDGRRPTESEIRRTDALQRVRDRHAAELGIDPTIIASKSTLFALARDWDGVAPGLMNWQRALLQ
jgi:ribonuclease D